MTAQENFIKKSTILKCLKMATVQTSMLLVEAYATDNRNAYIIWIELQRYFPCKQNTCIWIYGMQINYITLHYIQILELV